MILLNKWDLLGTEDRLVVSEAVADRLAFLGYAPVLRVSAKTGLGVQRLLPALREAINAYHRRIPTGRLNDGLRSAQSAHPAAGGRPHPLRRARCGRPANDHVVRDEASAPHLPPLPRALFAGAFRPRADSDRAPCACAPAEMTESCHAQARPGRRAGTDAAAWRRSDQA